MGLDRWNREQLILTINLYCKTPFGSLHSRNPDVIELAKLIGRTPGAMAWKLVNFASFDPGLKQRGISGAKNASKLDREIWDEFYNNWETLAFESEQLHAKTRGKTIEQQTDTTNLPKGKERMREVKIRINQAFFRSTVLATYNNSCCITGITIPELLIASHIVPWSKDEKNRMNPRNGLCINALHDKAFDSGLMTITPDYKIKLSPLLKKEKKQLAITEYFLGYENKKIELPTRFLPDPSFLTYHNDVVFQR